MCEDLFILAKSALSNKECSLQFALPFLLRSTRMTASTDDRHRGGAALQASAPSLVDHLEYPMFHEVEAFASPK